MNSNETTLRYLLKAAEILPSNNSATTLLKSYYLTKARTLAKEDFKAPPRNFRVDKCCSHCSTPWSQKKYQAKVIPTKRQNKSSRRKLNKVLEHEDNRKTKRVVVNKAKSELACNYMRMLCLVCKKYTKIETTKPDKLEKLSKNVSTTKTVVSKTTPNKGNDIKTNLDRKSRKQQDIIQKAVYANTKEVLTAKPIAPVVRTVEKIHKKKKTRDRFAGLCADVCLSLKKEKTNSVDDNNTLKMFLKPSN